MQLIWEVTDKMIYQHFQNIENELTNNTFNI